MTDPEVTERIRRLAYQLWEQAGRPDGRNAEFWDRAAVLVGDQILNERPEEP